MADKEELKKIWKQEAAQQRQDNLKKQKIVKKREVDIKFGGLKKDNPTSLAPDTHKPKLNDDSDSFLRQQLGL